LEEIRLTLHVPETPDPSNTVTDTYGGNTKNQPLVRLEKNFDVLRTRPVSSTLLPTEEPAIRDSKMEDTSDAANMTCHGTDDEKNANATSQPSVRATRQYDKPGFAVAYERATAGATREAF
jgi:hypothetical protein